VSELKIYTASAGSGKTFQLTRHYLELLFTKPDNYRKILAVTFTNKAAGELKERVLNELEKISGKDYLESAHFRDLANTLGLEDEILQQVANKVKRKILQNYGQFSIGTIDHFFQKVLRSFSKEVGINSGYKLELNTGIFLRGAIDLMMSDLGNDSGLMKWLGKWVDFKISRDENWNRVEKELETIGFEFLKEKLMEVMDDEGKEKYKEESITEFNRLISKIEKAFEKKLEEISQEANSLLAKYDLAPGDFKGGSRGPVPFLTSLSPEKLKNSRYKKAIDDPDAWCRKSMDAQGKERVLSAWRGGFNDLLIRANEYLDENEPAYQSSVLIRQHLYSLGLTGKLMSYINKHSDQTNSFLISLTAPLLSSIIAENPSPFLYEKVGTYYDSFMIDEFQDTSNLQWANFLPLINNSLSDNDFSMVVGDVKQSIFRWRNSNWKLMDSKAEEDVKRFGANKLPLKKNWRSRNSIIDFNNSFFDKAPGCLVDKFNEEAADYNDPGSLDPDLLKRIYAESRQDKGGGIPGGYVEVNFETEDDADNWDEKIPLLVEDLQLKYDNKPEDIVFLVRTNKQVRSIVKLLQDYQADKQSKEDCSYNIVSSESYQLQSSAATRCIIWAIKYIIDPKETYFQSRLAYEYISLKKRQASEADHENIRLLKVKPELFGKLLPDELKQNRLKYRYASCSRVIEEIIRLLELQTEKKDLPFIMCFRDQAINGLGSRNTLEDLVAWWDDQGLEVNVPMTEQTGSMRVMTIHKAKGLEFNTVIMPYCDWEMGGGNSKGLIWVDTGSTVFEQIPLLPFKFVKDLGKSSFSKAFYEEKLQIYLDNLNLVYVAFTRAKDRLYAFCPKKAKKGGYQVSSLLRNVLFQGDTEESIYSFGNPDTYPDGKKKTDGRELVDLVPFQPEPFSEVSSLRRDFDTDPIHHGRIMHEILEKTETISGLSQAVEELRGRGELGDEEAEKVFNHLENLLKRPDIADWFSGKYVSYRERSILIPDRGELRPDRLIEVENELIVLDYKFGEPREAHGRQVLRYKAAFETMGYEKVRAFLLYPDSGQLQEIA